VCAQGQNVRSSLPGNRYGLNSGTSMACPHVAGAVALLRQVDPNLSSDKVKEYLFTTCDDLGAAGPDNIFGNGRINLQSAYNKILTDRDRLSVGVFTTTRSVAQGNNLTFAINLINHTATGQFASVVVELEIVELAASAPIVGPFVGVYPAGFNLEPNWPTLSFGIPASLPPVFLTYTYRLRIRAIDSNSVEMSSAFVDFRIR
jgi:subtilisin family serine protease